MAAAASAIRASALPFGECVRNCFCWSQCWSLYVSRNRYPRRNRCWDTSPATISTWPTTRNRATTSASWQPSSDRIKLITVGKTTRGLDWEIAIISSPKNLAALDRNKQISQRLARGRGLDDAAAHALAREGKAIVHIDGGLHSTEVAGAQQSIALAYKLVSTQGDPEVDAILDNVILMLWPTLNPDGQNEVVSLVSQESRHAVRSLARCPICTRNTWATTTIATAT